MSVSHEVTTPNAQANHALSVTLPQGQLWLQLFSARAVRVVYAPNDGIFARESLVVRQPTTPVTYQVTETATELLLTTAAMQVTVHRDSGTVTFHDAQGHRLLSEAPGGRSVTPVTICDEATYTVAQRFQVSAEEALYGLGSNIDAPYMSCRGEDIRLVQANRIDVVPFLVSTNNWGLLWDNYSETFFHDGEDGMSLTSAVGDGIDYYVIAGGSIDDVIAGYRQLTGPAPMLPRWAFGYWQCRERYQSAGELTAIAAEFRERHFPIDILVQDWQWWPEDPGWWSGFHFDQQRFADLPGLLHALRETYHLHSMFSIWPAVGEQSDIYAEMDAKGLLFPGAFWNHGKVYDAFNPAARALYWQYANAALFQPGLDAWWMDGSEPEFKSTNTQDEFAQDYVQQQTCYLGSAARYLNPFALLHTQGIYEGQRATSSEKRVTILTRSAFAGQQRYATITWTGDTHADMRTLAAHIPAGVNFSMAGLPYWSHDIGAFTLGAYQGTHDPAYQELYVRWYQFGAFSPIFRSHGTQAPREPWQFGAPGDRVYDTLLQYDHLRYRLLPYIYSLAWRVTHDGYSLMRGLAMDFPADSAVHDLSTEYLFGPAFLVTPVTEHQYAAPPGAALPATAATPAVAVYLPASADWYDFWSGARLHGGQTIQRETPLELLPLYIRAGSIIPLGPEMQYTGEKAPDPIELRVYRGANGAFDLYEDEGDNYNYEHGDYATIPITWDDATETLTIGARHGSFPGMLPSRTFHLVFVDGDHGNGAHPAMPDRSVSYTGQEVLIRM